jgi:hypothetical protein
MTERSGHQLRRCPSTLRKQAPNMMHRYLSVLLLFIVLIADRTAAEAQTVFIPDTFTRTWLNIAKPNSVDANGDCDTAAWNASPPTAVGFDLTSVPNAAPLTLKGSSI